MHKALHVVCKIDIKKKNHKHLLALRKVDMFLVSAGSDGYNFLIAWLLEYHYLFGDPGVDEWAADRCQYILVRCNFELKWVA